MTDESRGATPPRHSECPACWGNGYTLDRHEERRPCGICVETGKVMPYSPVSAVAKPSGERGCACTFDDGVLVTACEEHKAWKADLPPYSRLSTVAEPSEIPRYTQQGNGMVRTFQQIDGQRFPAGDWVQASDYDTLWEAYKASVSASAAPSEGYPGIAHDLESLREALKNMTANFRTSLLLVNDANTRRLGLDLVNDAQAILRATDSNRRTDG